MQRQELGKLIIHTQEIIDKLTLVWRKFSIEDLAKMASEKEEVTIGTHICDSCRKEEGNE